MWSPVALTEMIASACASPRSEASRPAARAQAPNSGWARVIGDSRGLDRANLRQADGGGQAGRGGDVIGATRGPQTGQLFGIRSQARASAPALADRLLGAHLVPLPTAHMAAACNPHLTSH